MLNDITFWTADNAWKKIMTDLGGAFVRRDAADVIIDKDFTDAPMSAMQIYERALQNATLRADGIIRDICGNASLPIMQRKIIIALSRAGENGATMDDLARAIGYADGADTHAAATAIYNLRRQFGHGFIVNENGKYFIK